MKIHYINILLFALPLNILINTQNNPLITHHTYTNRSLCECEFYAPPNYDNDPQMKEVMDNFNKQTQQRFHGYDERMIRNRQKCKEQCDKEIKKIILKDKMEKELTETLTTLETKITTYDIPTCICEKSLENKVEKGCLKCGYRLGSVAPSVGLFGALAVNQWTNLALLAAEKAAIAKGLAAGIKAGNAHGMKIVIFFLKGLKADKLCPDVFRSFQTTRHYTEVTGLVDIIDTQMNEVCSAMYAGEQSICAVRETLGVGAIPGKAEVKQIDAIRKVLDQALKKATQGAVEVTKTTTDSVKAAAIETSTGAIETASYNLYTTIAYSITALLIIVLIMVIIYLVLRYRRKKKMKKKLQYIKLLEE